MRLVKSGARPGILAYRDRTPIAWCSVAPRDDYVALARSRVLQPIDDRPVWSISCLFVDLSLLKTSSGHGFLHLP